MNSDGTRVLFLGFGEAAQAFAEGFRQEGSPLTLRAFDIKTDGPQAADKWSDYDKYKVVGEENCSSACVDTDLIFSLVTADQAEDAATQVALSQLGGALFLDCNSCAPDTKRRSAKRIEAAGGRYVDVAVMTPVHPQLHKAPCLLGGPHATAALEQMRILGMEAKIAGGEVGDASVRKMIRSVMIKGLEALTLECFLAARKAGIENDILASLQDSFEGFDWQNRAPYMIERVMTHGTRRAAEMREVAQTLRDLGISPHVTDGTVLRQHETGALGLDAGSLEPADIAAFTDAILSGLMSEKQ